MRQPMSPTRQLTRPRPISSAHEQPPGVRADRAVRIPASRLDARVHDDRHEVVWQVRGSSQFRVDGRNLHLDEDDVLWIPAGLAHSAHLRSDSVIFHYHFPTAETATLLDDVSLAHLGPEETIFFLALKQVTTTDIRPRINLARQVLSILEHRILGGDDLPLPQTPAAASVAEALLFNPGDDRTVAQWAAEVHTSARSLERAFLRDTGLTLRQWRLHNRMKAASSLLGTGASIASVSRRVGYTSPNSFTRAFRAHFGTTPSQHRRQSPPPRLPRPIPETNRAMR